MSAVRGPWWFGISGSPKKGPVPLDYTGPGYYDNAAIFDADGEELVGCDEYHVFGDPDAIRLMVAAPMLLDCATDTLACLRLLSAGLLERSPEAIPMIDTHIDQILYAIKSATGEEA